MLKLNKLLYLSTPDHSVFYDHITPTIPQSTYLKLCRNDIKNHLKAKIKKATIEVLGLDEPVEPKFRDQGSWSYRTCLQPCHNPPQEMDWDFGVYLPITVWEENGEPRLVAIKYFELVQELLKDLCKEKGWELVVGKARNSKCIRIKLNYWSHIDIPLYVAPKEQFEELTEAAITFAEAVRKGAHTVDAIAFDETEMNGPTWDDMDGIFMATRTGEWKKSDPYVVTRWFKDRLAEQESLEEQLRRVCCYLKAWRDFHWIDSGGPSSILLMICAVECFKGFDRRDDIALEETAMGISNLLLNDVYCEAIDNGEENFNYLDQLQREAAASKANYLARRIQEARKLHGLGSANEALAIMSSVLGNRLPKDTSLIEVDTNQIDHIRTVVAEKVLPPIVPATKSGKSG